MSKRDHFDQKILRALASEGRLTNAELGERVGLSASSVSRRIAELERSGVIAGYRAVIDPVALGEGFRAFIGVGLSTHTKAAQESFERAMLAAPEVIACHNVTGAIEYFLDVAVADLPSYKRFHTEILGATPHVASILTYVVMASPKTP